MSEPQYLKKTEKPKDILDIDDIVRSLKKKGRRKKVVSGDDIGKLLNTKKSKTKKISSKGTKSLEESIIKEINDQ